MTYHRAAASLLPLLLAPAVCAQTWTRIPTATVPTARNGTGLAFDAVRGRAVMFGAGALPSASDTWEYDGAAQNWIQILPAVEPPLRNGHAMVYDRARDRVVLFGGASAGQNSTTYNDTWEYDGASQSWTQVTTAAAPPARWFHAMVYDLARGRTVLFGGNAVVAFNVQLLADTWEFDGSGWTRIIPPLSPQARWDHCMAYDAGRERIVMFGGGRPFAATIGDTWEYDGAAATWTQLQPTTVPRRRAGSAMVHDAARGRLVMWGGVDVSIVSTTYLDDTWEYDGADWAQVTVAAQPGARTGHAMTYDTARARILLFGGYVTSSLADTWEFGVAGPATWARLGVGCPGAAGTPTLDPAPGSLPALGTTFTVEVGSLGPSVAFVYLAAGFDDTTWNGAALPVALDPYGLPGCRLWIAPRTGALIPATGGLASYGLPIPNAPSLAGLVLRMQALSLDAGAPSGLGAVSNAGVLRVY